MERKNFLAHVVINKLNTNTTQRISLCTAYEEYKWLDSRLQVCNQSRSFNTTCHVDNTISINGWSRSRRWMGGVTKWQRHEIMVRHPCNHDARQQSPVALRTTSAGCPVDAACESDADHSCWTTREGRNNFERSDTWFSVVRIFFDRLFPTLFYPLIYSNSTFDTYFLFFYIVHFWL